MEACCNVLHALLAYPKLDDPVFAELYYYGEGDPRNTSYPVAIQPPEPGESVILYGHAVNFTRYCGSIFCDQPLSLNKDFASDRKVLARFPVPVWASGNIIVDNALPDNIQNYYPVDGGGTRDITDEDFPFLNYDARTAEVKYSPDQGGLKWYEIIYGVYLRLTLTHKGDSPIKTLRFSCCSSVF